MPARKAAAKGARTLRELDEAVRRLERKARRAPTLSANLVNFDFAELIARRSGIAAIARHLDAPASLPPTNSSAGSSSSGVWGSALARARAFFSPFRNWWGR